MSDRGALPPIALSGPDLGPEEEAAVLEVLRSGRLSMGPRTAEFEDALAARAGVAHGVSTSSGTAALHVAVKALGLEPGDEGITTPFSFVASSNCLLFAGVKPVFVDIEPDTLNIDPGRIRAAITERTKAIVAVDVFGHPAEWDTLRTIADQHGIKLIEDSAEAIGSAYKGRPAGGLGDAGVFAFYPNKQMTTGEGGALVTADQDTADLARSLSNHGRGANNEEWWLEHQRLGFNYRLSEIACALGLVQLGRLDELLSRRARVAAWYNERLGGMDGVEIPTVRDHVEIAWFVYVVRLTEGATREERDRVIEGLKSKGIGCRNYFPPIHLQPFYREEYGYGPGDFPITESVSERTVALPFHPGVTEAEVDRVVETLRELI
jgi:perosamine synthetase